MTGRQFFAVVNEDAGYTPAPDANGNFLLAPDFVVPSSYLKGSKVVVIAPAVGVAGLATVVIGGAYSIGDQVKLTIESNLTSKQKFVKPYVVDVVAGVTTNAQIATALGKKIEAEINAGLIDYPIASVDYTTTPGTVVITQKGDDKAGLITYAYTDSAAGTIVSTPTATTISEGQPSDLADKGVSADKINLASYDTVRIELNVEVPQPFIDSKGVVVKDLYMYTVVGKGAPTKVAIDAL